MVNENFNDFFSPTVCSSKSKLICGELVFRIWMFTNLLIINWSGFEPSEKLFKFMQALTNIRR